MKKMKMVLLAIVIITAVTGAYAAKKKFDCFDQPQYYYVSPGNYSYAGQFAVNYWCTSSVVTYCTYINTAPGVYEPCRYGTFSWINPPGK